MKLKKSIPDWRGQNAFAKKCFMALALTQILACEKADHDADSDVVFKYPNINGEENPRNYSYECEFSEHVLLPPISDNYFLDFCPANGILYRDQEYVGMLDNCVRYYCEYTPESGRMELWRLSYTCSVPPPTDVCRLGSWNLKHCFKFISDEGRKCTCEYGEIVCEK